MDTARGGREGGGGEGNSTLYVYAFIIDWV